MADQQLQQDIKARFSQLPKVVQDAITSADVEKRMRALADSHKLHLDQWESLENEVMLALLGFDAIENLDDNIEREVGVDRDAARALAEDISRVVFEPIRAELERQLEHPQAKTEQVSDIETARAQALAPAPARTAPTPPVSAPQKQVVRAPLSENYRPGIASSDRASVVDDPYREPPV